MVRKAHADGAEPRRSSRIKDQGKPDPPLKKAPAKPRSKKPKATAEEGDVSNKEKPKSAARGKKRTAAEKEGEYAQPAVNGEDAPPPAKKVRFPPLFLTPKLIASAGQNGFSCCGQACFQVCCQTTIQGCCEACLQSSTN